MADWKSLFPFVGEKTVARRLDDMFDRKTVVGALFGASVGGFVTTVIGLLTPGLPTALLAWTVVLLLVPILSVYWRTLQEAWDEVVEDDT